MTVTINTDASYSKRHRLGTFAFWIKCNYGTEKVSGICRGEVESPLEAELRAIANALFFLCRFPNVLSQTTNVIINTDCTFAIEKIQVDYKPGRFRIENCLGYFLQFFIHNLKQNYNISVNFRYVEAHRFERGTAWDTKRHFINDWCDKNAKNQMSIALATPHYFKVKKPKINVKHFSNGSTDKQRLKTIKQLL